MIDQIDRGFRIVDDVEISAHLVSREGRKAVRMEVHLQQENKGIPKGCAVEHKFFRLLPRGKFADIDMYRYVLRRSVARHQARDVT